MEYSPYFEKEGQSGPGLAGLVWGNPAPYGWRFIRVIRWFHTFQPSPLALAVLERTDTIISGIDVMPEGTLLAGNSGIILAHCRAGTWEPLKTHYGLLQDGQVMSYGEIEESKKYVQKNYTGTNRQTTDRPVQYRKVRKYRPVDRD